MSIHLSNGLQAKFNSFKNCWEFKDGNKVVRTCDKDELNETIADLLNT